MFDYINLNNHNYSFVVTGLRRKPLEYLFSSREAATKHMYKMCEKHGLHINKVYDDKHFKTYLCDCGVTFYINRA